MSIKARNVSRTRTPISRKPVTAPVRSKGTKKPSVQQSNHSFSSKPSKIQHETTAKAGVSRSLAGASLGAGATAKLSNPVAALSNPVATSALAGGTAETQAPQNVPLAQLAEQQGMQTNQDLINHFYREGGGTWNGAQAAARQKGADLNDLVRNRGGSINTAERPTIGGSLGDVIRQNGLETNQDLINHFYREGGGTWNGAQEAAQRNGADLSQLVQDRLGSIRADGSPGTTGRPTPTAPTNGATPPVATPATGHAAPVTQPGNGGVQDVLNTARNELALGVRENAGSNEDRQGHIRRYRNAVTAPGYAQDRPPEAWCADFVSSVFKDSGRPLGPRGQGFAAVAQMRNWFRGEGRYHTSNPQPGDVAFFRNFSHVAIVESVNADGTVTTIEGNTGPNGGGQQGVHRKTRRLSGLSGFGRM